MSTEKPGEPGTVAVEVGGKTPKGTYKAELGEKPPRLRLNDVGITYIDPAGQKTEAVKEITLDIVDKPGVGEIVVFLGPSGCGKSTILKAVAGILPHHAGWARLFEMVPIKLRQWQRMARQIADARGEDDLHAQPPPLD